MKELCWQTLREGDAMPKILCVKCKVEFRPIENGVYVRELMHDNTRFYKLWSADKWGCPVCKVEVVAGYGEGPLVEHFEEKALERVQEFEERGGSVILCKELTEDQARSFVADEYARLGLSE